MEMISPTMTIEDLAMPSSGRDGINYVKHKLGSAECVLACVVKYRTPEVIPVPDGWGSVVVCLDHDDATTMRLSQVSRYDLHLNKGPSPCAQGSTRSASKLASRPRRSRRRRLTCGRTRSF